MDKVKLNNNSNLRNNILFSCAALIINVTVGYFLLVAAYSIPYEMVKSNVDTAHDSIECVIDGKLVRQNNAICSLYYMKVDNNAIAMILTMVVDSKNSWLRQFDKNDPFQDCLINRISCFKNYEYFPWYYSENVEGLSIVNYSRYWNGEVVFLKPLFIFLNYIQICWLLVCLQFALIIGILLLMIKRKLARYIYIFILINILIGCPLTGFSFELSSMIFVTYISIIILLCLYDNIDKRHLFPMLLFINGIMIAYVDLLTYPLFSFGMLTCYYFLLRDHSIRNLKFRSALILVIKLFAFWILGYSTMWVSKFILLYAITGSNILFVVNTHVNMRIGWNSKYNLLSTISDNLSFLYSNIILIVCLAVLFILMIIIIVFNLLNKKKAVLFNKSYLIYLIIAIMPFFWYLCLMQHSFFHAYFTYRLLGITVMATIIFIQNSLNFPKKGLFKISLQA